MRTSPAYLENPEVEMLFSPHELRNTLSPDMGDDPDEEGYDDYELLESVIKPISYSEFISAAGEEQGAE